MKEGAGGDSTTNTNTASETEHKKRKKMQSQINLETMRFPEEAPLLIIDKKNNYITQKTYVRACVDADIEDEFRKRTDIRTRACVCRHKTDTIGNGKEMK